MGEWWAGGSGFWVCDSAFPCGFSHNKHRPLRVESFFQPFWDLLSEDFTAWPDTGAGVGGFLQLWNSLPGAGRLFYVLLLCPCPCPWAHYQCVPATQAPLLSLPHWSTNGDCNSTLHCYHICRVLGSAGLPWALSLSFPSLSRLCCWLRLAHLQVSMPNVSDLCVEQGILCWIMAAQLVVISRGETWRSSLTAMLLHSLQSPLFSWGDPADVSRGKSWLSYVLAFELKYK